MNNKVKNRIVKFVYDNQSMFPMIAHGKGFDCPFDDMMPHNPVECGDTKLFTLANENKNVLYKQPLLERPLNNKGVGR